MITIVANGVVKDGMLEEYSKVAREMMEETRKEKGCINYTFYKGIDNPNEVCFVEFWENQECIDAHNVSEHFTRLVPIMREMRNQSAFVKYIEG